jgi:hypothetical protein
LPELKVDDLTGTMIFRKTPERAAAIKLETMRREYLNRNRLKRLVESGSSGGHWVWP